MAHRVVSLILAGVLIALGIFSLRPYMEYRLYAATTPRAVEPRGDLADFERTTIAIFERVSPSVVQVVGLGQGGAGDARPARGEEQPVQSGTGFVWDQVGHVVTNDHGVEGANSLAVRLASGEAVRAPLVGGAPNFALA